MRWEALFRDLEAQQEGAEAAQLRTEIADRTRRETALLHLVDRLAPAAGHQLCLGVLGAGLVSGRLARLGAQWLLLTEGPGREVVVPLASVVTVSGAGRWSAPDTGAVFARLGLGSVLRGIARDRRPVRLGLVDGATLTGTIDRVGGDFVELAEHPPDEPRRRAAVDGLRLLPSSALALVRTGSSLP